MKQLLQHFRLMCARLDARQPRERLMVHVLVATLIWGLFDGLWFGQAQTRLKSLAGAEQAALQQLAQTQTEMRAQDQLLQHGPNEVLQAARVRWQLRQGEQQAALQEAGRDLLPAREVVALLQNLVVTRPGLQLLGLRNLEARAVGSEPAQGEGLRPLLWQHRLEIRLLGAYPDVLSYARHLEGLGLPLHRESLLLEASSGPGQTHAVKATLVLSNWSLDSKWMSF